MILFPDARYQAIVRFVGFLGYGHSVMYIRHAMHTSRHSFPRPLLVTCVPAPDIQEISLSDAYMTMVCVCTWISFAHAIHRHPAISSPTHHRSHTCLLSEQPAHPLEHAILLGIVRMVLGRDLEQRGESGCVRLHAVSYPLGDLWQLAQAYPLYHPFLLLRSSFG